MSSHRNEPPGILGKPKRIRQICDSVNHQLLATGRYEEARGKNKSAYQGHYEVVGNCIQYRDDSGFTADGHFHDDVLYHAGMILYRQCAV